MRRRCEHIIDSYLYNGAELQVTLPDHSFKKKSDVTTYDVSEDMFDDLVTIAYKSIRREQFMRFRLTDEAEKLAIDQPHQQKSLADEPLQDGLTPRSTALQIQHELRDKLVSLADRVGCERATV